MCSAVVALRDLACERSWGSAAAQGALVRAIFSSHSFCAFGPGIFVVCAFA
jgi:hypothetical protein